MSRNLSGTGHCPSREARSGNTYFTTICLLYEMTYELKELIARPDTAFSSGFVQLYRLPQLTTRTIFQFKTTLYPHDEKGCCSTIVATFSVHSNKADSI